MERTTWMQKLSLLYAAPSCVENTHVLGHLLCCYMYTIVHAHVAHAQARPNTCPADKKNNDRIMVKR